MPLYDPAHCPATPPEDQIAAVRSFLLKCREWATEREIQPRLQQVVAAQDPDLTRAIHDWVTFRHFLEHAIGELEDGRLDPWFLADPTPGPPEVPDPPHLS